MSHSRQWLLSRGMPREIPQSRDRSVGALTSKLVRSKLGHRAADLLPLPLRRRRMRTEFIEGFPLMVPSPGRAFTLPIKLNVRDRLLLRPVSLSCLHWAIALPLPPGPSPKQGWRAIISRSSALSCTRRRTTMQWLHLSLIGLATTIAAFLLATHFAVGG